MNRLDNQKIISYLDRELTLEESAAFEKTASSGTLDMFQREWALGAGLAERLNGPDCPQALWKSLRQQLKAEKETVSSRMLWFPAKSRLWIPLAASLFIMVGLYFSTGNHGFLQPVSTVAALEGEARLGDPAERLAGSGFNLQVLPDPDGGHAVSVLGAYTETLAGEPVVVVCVNCCGEPLRVLLSRKGSRSSGKILSKKYRESLQSVIWRGEYQLTVIGEHPAAEVLDLFQEA